MADLRELVAQWRAQACGVIQTVNDGQAPPCDADVARGWRHCADELEAAHDSPGVPRTIEADECEHLMLMGLSPDGTLRLGEGAAQRVLDHAKRLVLASPGVPAAQGWQDISTAPKDGTEVLLTNGRWKRTGYWAKRIERWSVDTAVPLEPPTHWMPLPAAPSAGPAPSNEQRSGEQVI